MVRVHVNGASQLVVRKTASSEYRLPRTPLLLRAGKLTILSQGTQPPSAAAASTGNGSGSANTGGAGATS